MRFALSAVAWLTLLSGCNSRPVEIANDHCWSLEPGDRVFGNVVIVGIVEDGLTEGGTFIQNTACPSKTVGLAIANGPALDIYRKTIASSPPQFVERRFQLTGHVYQNKGSDRLRIKAESLRPVF